MRTAPAMSAAGQSLEMKPLAPAALRRVGADAAGAGDQQDVEARAERDQLLADLGAGLLADEQVHERDVRVIAAGERECLLRVAGAQRPLYPRLLAQHHPQAPVHDLVVVDDEHAQLAVARAAGDPRRIEVRSGQAAPPIAPARCRARVRRTRRCPPNCSASSAASLRPMPCWRALPRTPSLTTSSTSVSPSLISRLTSTLLGPACLWALRTASASTDWASGSSSCGISTASEPSRSVRCRSRCSRPQPLDLLQQRGLRLGGGAAERALQRAAQVLQRGLQLRADALARGGAELGLAGEHELDAEQALDHRLVDLAREVHPLLQLARLGLLVRGQAGEGGQRGGLAERVEQVALGVAQRRACPGRGR